MSLLTITVTDSPCIKLAYTDSGLPTKNDINYTTIFAIHGLCFSTGIFRRMASLAPDYGVRLVAISRRGYPGSTPYSREELETMKSTDNERFRSHWETRGHEYITFIDKFSRQNNLPPVSQDGRTGGIVLAGWSLGVAHALMAISSSSTFPDEQVRRRLGGYIRSLVLYDGGFPMFGFESPAQSWTPMQISISDRLRYAFFGQWISAYFTHEDASSRNPEFLSWIIPATDRVPSIFAISNQSPLESYPIQCFDAAVAAPDIMSVHGSNSQQILHSAYEAAFYDPVLVRLFPHMRIHVLCGERTAGQCVAAFWAVQEDQKNRRDNGSSMARTVEYTWATGANHFIQWDDPETALKLFMKV